MNVIMRPATLPRVGDLYLVGRGNQYYKDRADERARQHLETMPPVAPSEEEEEETLQAPGAT